LLEAIVQMISHVELRSEDSPDILPYTHDRKIEKIVVSIGKEIEVSQIFLPSDYTFDLQEIRQLFVSIMDPYVLRLHRSKAIRGIRGRPRGGSGLDSAAPVAESLAKYSFIMARDEFRRNPPGGLSKEQQGAAEGDFAAAISLYHAYDLLNKVTIWP